MEFQRRTQQWTRPAISNCVSRTAVPNRVRSSAVRSLEFPAESRANPSSFYGSAAAERSNTWEPGQHIPLSVPESPSHGTENVSVVDVLQTLQSSIDGKFTKIISERLCTLESKQNSIEEKIAMGCSLSSTPQSSCSESGSRRKRRTPVSLQNKIHLIHNALDEDNQFKIDEPITSAHNNSVVQQITSEIGVEKYNLELIRDGCKTYRKSLAEKPKSMCTPIKKRKQLRSLKQRSYERRTRAIKASSEKEKKYWAEVTADMMYDEEKVEDKYIRHQPTYRSERLNSFIRKLDGRLESTPSRHARHVRVLGSPVERQPPTTAKKWMIKSTPTSTATHPPPPPPANEEDNGDRVSDEEARVSDEGSFNLSGTELD